MTVHPSVLLIDDDVVATFALKSMLTDAGYPVESASDGLAGLRMALTGRYRIIITDWMMPELPGVELCKKVRQANLPHYVYTILLSQRSRSADVVEGLNSGADDYLTKPITQGELMAKLRGAERMLSLITRDVTIFSLAKLAESRDPDTGAHLERVRHNARVLAEELRTMPDFEAQIDDEFIRLLFLTAPLHDIGKVGIPDIILLKPDRLSDEEFEVMKSHTTIGANTLEAALQAHPGALYLQMARDIALTHHERFDGTGYPLGLKGTAIPLSGRIVAVADVYDALTSRRVYKSAYTHEVAQAIILEQRGRQFDPDVVEAFLSREREFRRIKEQFSDDNCTYQPTAGPLHCAA
jgi:putative two-component system response regulator